jgi:acyl-CoA dehydrogenase
MAMDFPRSWETEEISAYRETVARFVERELAAEDAAARERGHTDPAIWRRAGELGFLCTDIPQEWGGAGGDFRHEAVFYEERFRRGLTSMSSSVHAIAARYILNHGTLAQKQRYLPRMVRGELLGAIAMSEPGAGSDLHAVRTRAVRQGGSYVIDGSKTFITNGLNAGLVVVVCKTNPAEKSRGLSLVLVETRDCPGFRVGRLLDKIGLKGQDTAELFFDGVTVPADNLLGGEEGRGFAQLMTDLAYERTIIGVASAATMEGALRETLAYTRERQAFGRPVADFQATRFKLAEIATTVRVARAFVDRCVEDLLAGRLDAAGAAMCKLWCSEQQGRVIDDCLQLFGGYGYMNEYLIARMYTDARIYRIFGGTSEIMKEVIARAL